MHQIRNATGTRTDTRKANLKRSSYTVAERYATLAGLDFRHNNHYVPQMLLRQFSRPEEAGSIWEYRLLVPVSSYPDWEPRAPSSIAKTRDLYTIAEGADESDAMERWLDEEFEHPASSAVAATVGGQRLDKRLWRLLIRLYAAQFVRVPAFFVRNRNRWAAEQEAFWYGRRDEMLKTLPKCRDADTDVHVIEGEDSFPVRCIIRKHEGLRRSLEIQHITGRKQWMWNIKTMLRPSGTLGLLESYKWSILTAPPDSSWFLTDNPAVSVIRRNDGFASLDAGWGTKGSRLMLPLSPKHLLFHCVGFPLEERYMDAPPHVASQIRCDLADAAYRSYYSDRQDAALTGYRPRDVDLDRFRFEQDAWKAFGQEHSCAERWEKASSL